METEADACLTTRRVSEQSAIRNVVDGGHGDRSEMASVKAATKVRWASAGLLTLVVVACSATPTPDQTVSASGSYTATASPSATLVATPTATSSLVAMAKGCPVTEPEQAPSTIRGRFFGGRSAYGNGELWVGGLWQDGIINAGSVFIDTDGSVGMKFGWWRETPGSLTITGRRLDAPAGPLRSEVPFGYGSTGFQATGVFFPTEGCWEVTGHVGNASLTFITFVIKSES
jgi:hypothetical protein